MFVGSGFLHLTLLGREMAMAYRFFILLFFAFVTACSAGRNTVFLSAGEEINTVGIHGRSLILKLNDYGETSANNGHDPRNRGGNGRGGGGRRTP